MDVLKEQRIRIKFCQKLGKMATETYKMLQKALGETALSQSKTFEWKKARQVRSNVNTMLITFFEGLVHHEFLLQCQTMDQTVYITILQHLRDAVCWKWPHKWSSSTWLLHHDNAPCHAALNVMEFLAKHSIPMVPHPPYPPDLAPCDFFFPMLDRTLKGNLFQDIVEIQLNDTAVAGHSQTGIPDMH
jgi:hypothetical protein